MWEVEVKVKTTYLPHTERHVEIGKILSSIKVSESPIRG